MRVGLLIYGSLDTLSGGYLYDRKLVAHLQNMGDEVEIISLPWRNYAAHLTDNFSASLLRRLAGSRFDVLVQDELNHPSLFWLNQRLRNRVRYPIVSIVHHLRSSELRPAWQNKFYRSPELEYLRSVDGFIFNGETTRSVVEGLVGKLRPHVVAYPAGNRLDPQISNANIFARARENQPLKIAFLGSVIPRKNLHTLLDALALLEGDWHLTVMGSLDADPTYVRGIRKQAARLGLSENLTFRGAIGDVHLKTALQENHVLALPSSYEGFGIAYLEGMGYGLPAIGSTDGAAHEIITPDLDGFLVQPDDAEALAAHLQDFIDDSRKLVRMSLAARERYLAHPLWRDSMKRIRKFLSSQREVRSHA